MFTSNNFAQCHTYIFLHIKNLFRDKKLKTKFLLAHGGLEEANNVSKSYLQLYRLLQASQICVIYIKNNGVGKFIIKIHYVALSYDSVLSHDT